MHKCQLGGLIIDCQGDSLDSATRLWSQALGYNATPGPDPEESKYMALDTGTLIFDLDGTISDPSEGICRSFNHALQAQGYDALPTDTIRAEIGPPLDEAFRNLVPGLRDSDISTLVASYRERYAVKGFAENRLYPNMSTLVTQLAASGYRLGICTSKPRHFACQILDLFELLHLFEFVDGGDIGIKKKSQLHDLLKKDIIDTHAIMIGDRAVDILAASSNGLRSVAVMWGFGSARELNDAGPDFSVQDVSQLQSLVAPGNSAP